MNLQIQTHQINMNFTLNITDTSSTFMFSLALVSNTRTPIDSPKRTASWVSTCFRAGSSFLFPTESEQEG